MLLVNVIIIPDGTVAENIEKGVVVQQIAEEEIITEEEEEVEKEREQIIEDLIIKMTERETQEKVHLRDDVMAEVAMVLIAAQKAYHHQETEKQVENVIAEELEVIIMRLMKKEELKLQNGIVNAL